MRSISLARFTVATLGALSLAACADAPALWLGTDQPVVLALADVTLVWPLPDAPLASAEELDELGYVRAAPAGRDAHLPRDVVDQLPRLTRVDELDDLYDALTVTALRFDPCFQEGPLDELTPCEPNVRLVLQPIRPPRDDASAPPESRDASLHAFYTASEHDVIDAVQALYQMRVEQGVAIDGPLDVHPLLTDAVSRAAVRRVLRPLLDPAHLVRVTATTVHANDTAWTFIGIDRHAEGGHADDGEDADAHADGGHAVVTGDWHGIDIPTIGAHEQHAISDGGTVAMQALLEPAPAIDDDLSLLLDEDAARAATAEALQSAYDAAARIENPLLHNPGTVDCGSCHLAAAARVGAERIAALADSADAFSSTRYDLTPTAAFADSGVVRALGYRFRTLAIAPRVTHESALVAARIEHTLRTRSAAHDHEDDARTDDGHADDADAH